MKNFLPDPLLSREVIIIVFTQLLEWLIFIPPHCSRVNRTLLLAVTSLTVEVCWQQLFLLVLHGDQENGGQQHVLLVTCENNKGLFFWPVFPREPSSLQIIALFLSSFSKTNPAQILLFISGWCSPHSHPASVITTVSRSMSPSLTVSLCLSHTSHPSTRPPSLPRLSEWRFDWISVSLWEMSPLMWRKQPCSIFICATTDAATCIQARHLLQQPPPPHPHFHASSSSKVKQSAKWAANMNPFPVSFSSSSVHLLSPLFTCCHRHTTIFSPSAIVPLSFNQHIPHSLIISSNCLCCRP